jgi:general secretion pathway protein F
MAVYEYQAIAGNGKSVKGVIDADSPAAARRKLREQKLHPTKLAESFEKKGETAATSAMGMGRIKLRDLSLMTRQLAILLDAGMALVEALTAVLDQTQNPRLRKVIFDVRDRVNEGTTLADALARHPRVFSDLYTNMVRAGETSGALETVLDRVADIQERQAKMRARVLAALIYPIIMAVFGTGVIIFLMMAIVPKIARTLTQRGQTLPAITEVLIGTCAFLEAWWWAILLVIAGLYVTWRFWVSRPEGRLRWDRFKLSVPKVGELYMKMVCSRFARTLGSMMESGLTMMTALDVVRTVLDNRVIQNAMDDVKTGVRRGRDLATPLRESGLFPPMLLHMVELGQRSGELEAMLIKTADTYDEDVGVTVDALVSLLEPLMIVVMGFFVGFLVLAVLLPIFQMSQGMG